MKFTFEGGILSHSDYYGSVPQLRGQAWLAVVNRSWHLLLPGPPRSKTCVQIYPIPCEEENEGWLWCMDVDGQRFSIPRSCIHGRCPEPPLKGQHFRRAAVLYTGETRAASRAAFGGTHELRDGLNGWPCQLWVTCGFRVSPVRKS